jgi:hypothetical protein
MIRKPLIAAVAATCALASGATLAAAEKPSIEPVENSDLVGRFCEGEDFQVLVHPLESSNAFQITFSDGGTIFAGKLKLRVTNLETGKTITFNASGPAFVPSDGTTITLRGATLLVGEAGFFGPGSEARLTLGGGPIVVDLVTGAILSEKGHSTDLCPILADPTPSAVRVGRPS